MNIQQNENVNNFLKRLGFENISASERQLLFSKLNNAKSLDEFKREMEMLLSLNKVLISVYNEVSIRNMLMINKNIDHELISELFLIYNQIKEKAKDETICLLEFKKVVFDILKLNAKSNQLIGVEVDESYNKSLVLKENLYLAMLDVDKADEVFNNCVNRTKEFLQQNDTDNLTKLIVCLKKNFSFSNEEIVELSKKCATFFAFSSASKINNLNKTIKSFRKYIEERLKITNESFDASKLLSINIKDVLKSSASIAIIKEKTVTKTLEFLMGSKVGDLIETDEKLASIKGNFTPGELARIYNKSITSLSVSVEKIVDVCDSISKVYEKTYNQKLDIDNLITGRNFSSLAVLKKEDYKSENSKMEDIFNMLKEFFPAKDMENLLKRNFSFLLASKEEARKSLTNAILNSSNMEELRRNILKKIKSSFDRNDGKFVEVERSEGYNLGKLEKVGVKEFKGKDLEDVLNKFNTDPKDIIEWKNTWKDDTRGLNEFETQCDLEDLSVQLDTFDNFYWGDVTSEKDFIETIATAKDLFDLVKNKYKKIIANNELSPTNQKISNEVIEKMKHASNLINEKINEIVKVYEEQVSLLNAKLSEINADNISKLEEINKEIEEKNINEDDLLIEKAFIDHTLETIDRANKRYKENIKREKEAEILFNKFAQKLISDLKLGEMGIESKDTMYVYNTFAKILADKGFSRVINYVDSSFVNKNVDYEKYRESLTPAQLKVTDKIYAIISEYEKENFEVLSDIYGCFILFKKNINFKDINLGIRVLSKFLENKIEDNKQKKKMFSQKRFYEESLKDTDINNIKKIEEKTGEEIKKYLEKIQMMKKNKIR